MLSYKLDEEEPDADTANEVIQEPLTSTGRAWMKDDDVSHGNVCLDERSWPGLAHGVLSGKPGRRQQRQVPGSVLN